MAVDGRINVRHEDVFPVLVLVLGVEPVNDFEKVKAKVPDAQERDRETGMRLWAVSVLDPSAKQGQREIKVKVGTDTPDLPVPNVIGLPARVIPPDGCNRWSVS